MTPLAPIYIAVVHRDPDLVLALSQADRAVRAVHLEPIADLAETLARSDCDVILLHMGSVASPALFCRALRARSSVPLLLIGSAAHQSARIEALGWGADAIAVDTTTTSELIALLQALVRRARGLTGPQLETFSVGDLSIFPESNEAEFEGVRVQLSTYEFALLNVLARHAGQPLGREQLLDLAKGSAEAAYDRSIDVQISRLRHKLGDNSARPRLIKTVRGVGYVLATRGGAR